LIPFAFPDCGPFQIIPFVASYNGAAMSPKFGMNIRTKVNELNIECRVSLLCGIAISSSSESESESDDEPVRQPVATTKPQPVNDEDAYYRALAKRLYS
jgi:hypothetical protein